MHLDADELLARIKRDYPDAYEYCRLVLLTEKQAAEIERLNKLVAQQQPYAGAAAVSYLDTEQTEGRHG